MAYIDYSYYKNEYHGTDIMPDDFDKIAEISSMIVDSIVYCRIDTTKHYMKSVKKAVAYEADTVLAYGGADVAFGLSDTGVSSESLGDYSYSLKENSEQSVNPVPLYYGIPVSPVTLSILSNAGLRNRCANCCCEGDCDDKQ